jgi:deoxyribonuclease V
MFIDDSLPWTYDLDQAIRLQENLSRRIITTWDGRAVSTVAGVDTYDAGETIHAAIAVYHYPELTHIATVTCNAPQSFPYISGLLAFRIGPAILAAWDRLMLTPDMILMHGHGIAHPRGLGLASHVGLWLNIPTIGVAKTRLYGKHADVGPEIGDWSEIHDEHKPKKIVGALLRTQVDARPIYVSPGHLVDLAHSIEFALGCNRGFRMPEPIQAAAQAASDARLKDHNQLIAA